MKEVDLNVYVIWKTGKIISETEGHRRDFYLSAFAVCVLPLSTKVVLMSSPHTDSGQQFRVEPMREGMKHTFG